MYWADNICKEFLNTDGLERILPHLSHLEAQKYQRILKGHTRNCPSNSPTRLDPISDTVVAVLTRPLHLILNDLGAMPFHDRPALIFPYHLMTHGQKTFIRNCIDNVDEWTVTNELLVFRKPPCNINVCPVATLTTTCKAVIHARSSHDVETRIKLCNIVLQRVQGHYPLDARMQRIVNECVKANTQTGVCLCQSKPTDK